MATMEANPIKNGKIDLSPYTYTLTNDMFGLLRNKTNEPSPFQDCMDCHCHLLWGVDDGAHTREESQAMIDELRHLGFRGAWCTPHIMANTPNNTPALLEARFAEALETLALGNFDLRLAAEYMLDEQFPEKLDQAPLLTYDGKHLLVELSQVALPRNWEDMIFQIKLHDYIPVLAHPERYCHLLTEDQLLSLYENDVEFQLNLSSLTDQRGKTVQNSATQLLKANAYAWWGSDAHCLDHVTTLGKTASRYLKAINQISHLRNIQLPRDNKL